MKKIMRIADSCVLTALYYVSGKDEETVIRMCRALGFKEGEGMSDEDWQEAAGNLGVEFTSVRMRPVMLRTFLKKYSGGLFLVSTFDHLFVVDNGVIVDPRCEKPPGLKRIIQAAWRVES